MTLVYIYLVGTQQIVDITKCQTYRYLYIICIYKTYVFTKLTYNQNNHSLCTY